MIKRSTNFEAVALRVKYGNHAIELTIFNYRDTSPSHNFKSMSSQANIFSISPISAKSIIKCFPVEAEDFKNSLIRVIK